MLYLKCIGSILIFASALYISRAYSGFCNAKHGECKSFLTFLQKIRKDISRFLSPKSKWKSEVEIPKNDFSGFFGAVKGGCSLSEAYELSRQKLLMPEELKNMLSEFFSDFGRGYMQDELAKLDEVIKELSAAASNLGKEAEKEVRTAKTLIFAVAIGLVILLI